MTRFKKNLHFVMIFLSSCISWLTLSYIIYVGFNVSRGGRNLCRVLLCEKSNGVPLIYSYSCVTYNTIKEEGVRTGVLHWKLKLTNTICRLFCTYTFLALDHGVLS